MRNRVLVCLWPLLVVFLGFTRAEEPSEQAVFDERLLKDQGLSAERGVLLRFFKLRTISDAERAALPKVIEKLGDDTFEVREAAQAELLARGPSIRETLVTGTKHRDAEVARRCRELVDLIDHGPASTLTIAAVRVLSGGPMPEALPVLLDYLPFAEDESVTEEVLEGLTRLARGTTPDVLRDALKSERVDRRSAAAFVLGRSENEATRASVMPLLTDENLTVRFRAAQSLLIGKEAKAVPVLIDLIEKAPAAMVYRVEDMLFNLAGPDAPSASTGTATTEERTRSKAAWSKWWDANASKADLARASRPTEHLGLNVLPEMHANKVWECGRDGKPIWELAGLACPIDARVLPGNRILVAELNGHRVTERDRTGKIFWEHKVTTPIACERLPSGATWISTNHRYFTVTPDGREIPGYTPENGFFIHSAFRLRSGHVAVVSMAGEIREINPAGDVVRTISLKVNGSWSGISVTPQGRYLVTNNGQGLIQEVDTTGKIVWELTRGGACYATRLPNGNTLVVSNSTGLVEVDRDGKVMWEVKAGTSLWRGHRR